MARIEELEPRDLFHPCDVDRLDFETTDDLADLEGILGQPRALAALEFGTGIDSEGYNIFAFGPVGTGKRSVVLEFLRRRAGDGSVPFDDCYVHNFADAHRPRLLRLPAGRGAELSREMEQLVDELRTALRTAFETEDYQTRRQVIESDFQERQESALNQISDEAVQHGLALLRTPIGIVFAPVRDKEVLSPEEFQKLPAEKQEQVKKEIERFEEKLQKTFRQFPGWQRETRERLRKLNRQVSRIAVEPLIDELRRTFEGLTEVQEYLDAVQEDVLDNARSFLKPSGAKGKNKGKEIPLEAESPELPFERRYRVNVLVERGSQDGVPVIYEDHPTYPNLVGRVEHLQQMGALITDFSLIKPGALHRANGGYLVLDALRLLQQPFAWEGLKRALQSAQVKIESVGQALSLISTFSIEPEPVPLDVKLVLLGSPLIYYLLSTHEPDFGKLFKVAADFSEELERSPDSEQQYARLIAKLVRKEKLPPFERGAVARVIEHGARFLGDSKRLSLFLNRVVDQMREAAYWAQEAGRERVAREDVQRAIDALEQRSDRLRERTQEAIRRKTLLIDTDGEAVGQVNGLSVLQLGDFAFGRPSRITARVRMGKGEVVDIEREVELSGPIHAKGVLIMAGFLGERYAADRPLSLSASLVFEQSYSGVEGDSASSAELYALLSAISETPIRQSLAVTGSVNQRGQIQPVGGINEKIEGFFDVCKQRGLEGEHGVLIPASNVQHLMLRRDVVEAVAAGRFHVYPVETVDQGIELLTGAEAGERGADGLYPEGSVNCRVENRLRELALKAKEFSRPSGGGEGE